MVHHVHDDEVKGGDVAVEPVRHPETLVVDTEHSVAGTGQLTSDVCTCVGEGLGERQLQK